MMTGNGSRRPARSSRPRPWLDKPNVVVMMCDQLRAFEVGCYGNPVIRTPNTIVSPPRECASPTL